MYNHEPKNYICPFCLINDGIENEKVFTKQKDIIFKNKNVIAFIASHGWPNNQGHVIITTRKHIENIYDFKSKKLYGEVFEIVRKISIVIKKAYKCEGITIRQHNEPIGGQDVWHYHVHVFPRYKNDNLNKLYDSARKLSEPKEREKYAKKLKKYLKK